LVAASSARRSVTGSYSEIRLSVTAYFTTRWTSSLGMLCVLAVVQVCVHASGSAVCGAPGGAAVKSSLGSTWLAVRALPRHVGQVCTWATGESLLHPLPLLLFHWPWSLTMLVKTSEPSSQSLLCDAVARCMFESVHCDYVKSCDTLRAPLLPLSARLLTEMLFLNLAHLQDSVSTRQLLAVLYTLS
jgi:hypothetical protein